MEDCYRSRNSAHPLLRGGKTYPHGFSYAEMEPLTALCETFIPSLSSYNNGYSSTEAKQDFDSISGSEDGLPGYVAGFFATHCTSAALAVIRSVLLCLYTRPGTLLFCGRASLTKPFPYVRSFAAIPLHVREKAVLKWSLGTGSVLDPLFQMIFKGLKSCAVYAFYSRANEDGWNPSWKAIGYSPPLIQTPEQKNKPLDGGIIDVCSANSAQLQAFLEDAGFDVSASHKLNYIRSKIEKGSDVWKIRCDVVVIGSGAGGGVAAGKLAQAGYKVVVVEKGNYFAGEDLSLLEGPSLDQMYSRGGLLTSTDAGVSIMAGATVGGGSAINWSASIRTPPHVLRDWAESHGLALFQTQEYDLAMNEAWARAGVSNAPDNEGFQNAVLRKGCAALGYEVADVAMNALPGHACGISCSYGCRSGEKMGTADTWLVDAIAAGARILARCEALEVTWTRNGSVRKPRTATGVLCRAGEGYFWVEATATVVACGALMTPGLLMASGLKNPNVGKNLHLHPVRMAWGYFPPEKEPPGRSYEGNIITALCKEGSRWDSGGYGAIIQTPALGPGCFASLTPWISGADMKKRMRRYDRTAHLFTLTRDRGGGSVGRNLDVEYRVSDEVDRRSLDESLERALRVLIAAGAAEVGTHHSDGRFLKVEGADKAQIEGFLREVKETKAWCPLISAHQMGSCRMGIDPATSCVDENGESWEVEGLFVSDASVFPTAVGVNPMMTVQSVALCISRRVEQFLLQNIVSPPSSSSSYS